MSYNKSLLGLLIQIQDASEVLGHVYRAKAYRRAIFEISKLNYDVKGPLVNISKIPGVGSGIAAKIMEFINTGNIKEVDELTSGKEYQAYKAFGGITGVGPATIASWIKSRIYTLSQLRQAISRGKIVLNNMQKYGLKYYDDLNTRIPREDVMAIGELVKRLLIQIDPGVIFTIAGSYRRGAASSGDIDILVSNNTQYNDDLLSVMTEVLRTDRNFIDTLSTGKERVTFLYAYKGIVRQVDVLNIRYMSYFAALNYFTGSFEHNARLRGIAKAKGYRLNQNGLFRVVKTKLVLVPIESEKDIYDALGVRYIAPNDR